MPWMWLCLAIVLEVTATVCMKLSDGCSRVIPSVLMILLYGVSFFPTAMALRRLDVGMAYAVWSAVGTTLITLIGVVLFEEHISFAKMAALAMIIFGVVILNLSGNGAASSKRSSGEGQIAATPKGPPASVLLASGEPSSVRLPTR